jgi:hypothetical protein
LDIFDILSIQSNVDHLLSLSLGFALSDTLRVIGVAVGSSAYRARIPAGAYIIKVTNHHGNGRWNQTARTKLLLLTCINALLFDICPLFMLFVSSF